MISFKNLSKESALFVFSVCAMIAIYSLWEYFRALQVSLVDEIVTIKAELSNERRRLKTLRNTMESLQSVFKQERGGKKISRHYLGEILKNLANKNKLLHIHFSFMPEKSIHKDASLTVKKSFVRINFSSSTDRDVMEFLKGLFSSFPGIIQSKELKLKKEELNEQDAQFLGMDLLIRGTYSFEWFDISYISDKGAS
ncbi:hypothetical protein [Candidatus Hydrogenosomobacter endosymbioticus]|uniref:Uncharacterized protein n=1 Tax=Candidatus Hydrogenosomobacter endosymbioticus TaxID=2558174 RepID=A0ABM7V9C6_9PROT|nr:hypothetical protein [Candidatus Hydrogenosomobacter endosymbioticus]BDB96413.1 hypothetical protein HYD_5460 [Candidatus Hydrogenosomobacter endosymbioticus]